LGLKLRELIISCSRGKRLANVKLLRSFDSSSGFILGGAEFGKGFCFFGLPVVFKGYDQKQQHSISG